MTNATLGTIEKQNRQFILVTIGGCEFVINDSIKVEGMALSDSDVGHIAILEGWNLKVTVQEDEGTDEDLEAKFDYIRNRLEKGLQVA